MFLQCKKHTARSKLTYLGEGDAKLMFLRVTVWIHNAITITSSLKGYRPENVPRGIFILTIFLILHIAWLLLQAFVAIFIMFKSHLFSQEPRSFLLLFCPHSAPVWRLGSANVWPSFTQFVSQKSRVLIWVSSIFSDLFTNYMKPTPSYVPEMNTLSFFFLNYPVLIVSLQWHLQSLYHPVREASMSPP